MPAPQISKRDLKFGKKLLGYALDNFYFFDNDEIENIIDRMELKYKRRGRVAVRSSIWSHENIRAKICQIATKMYSSPNSN